MIQVQTNGAGNDASNGHNRFALRAYGNDGAGNNKIALSAFNKIAIYADLPSATTKFYLARLPGSAAGKDLNVRLFDVGNVVGRVWGTLGSFHRRSPS